MRAVRGTARAWAIRLSLLGPCTILISPAPAYILSTAGTDPESAADRRAVRWDLAEQLYDYPASLVDQGRIVYRLAAAGSDDIGDGSDLAEVRKAFQLWEDVADCPLAFVEGPVLAGGTPVDLVQDGRNSIFWAEASTVLGGGSYDITGLSGLTVYYTARTGSAAGIITEGDIVLNGVEESWTTTPELHPGRLQVDAVVSHEVGHLLGLSHSPVLSSLMYPIIDPGLRAPDGLSLDEELGARALYGAAAGARAVSGTVRMEGVPVFGGLVILRGAAGGLVLAAITDPGGRYELRGLPAGDYLVHVEPLDSETGAGFLPPSAMGGIYLDPSVTTGFRSSADVAVTVGASGTTTLDLAVQAGVQPWQIVYVKQAGTTAGWYSAFTSVNRGAAGVSIGVAGPGLPSSDALLRVSGEGVTVTGQRSGFGVAGYPAIEATLDVHQLAAPGPRHIWVEHDSVREVAPGALLIVAGPDTFPPEPSPMRWAAEPHAVAADRIEMEAQAAIDLLSPPVAYFFDERSGSPGASDSGWIATPAYADDLLAANRLYRYRVTARDSAPTPNVAAFSSEIDVWTLAAPGPAPVWTALDAVWAELRAEAGQANPAATEWALEMVQPPGYLDASGALVDAAVWYIDTRSFRILGLTPGATVSARVRTRNGAGVESAPGPAAAGLLLAESASDLDGDGVTDAAEWAAGTDYLDPLDFLAVTEVTWIAADRIGIAWRSRSDRAYFVEGAVPGTAAWTPLLGPVPGTGAVTSAVVPIGDAGAAWLRVRVDRGSRRIEDGR